MSNGFTTKDGPLGGQELKYLLLSSPTGWGGSWDPEGPGQRESDTEASPVGSGLVPTLHLEHPD